MSNHRQTHHKGNKYMYAFYKKSIKEGSVYDVSQLTYGNILKDFNLFLMDSLIFHSSEIYLPCRLGKIYIEKLDTDYERSYIDWKESKKKGRIVKKLTDVIYTICWEKRKCNVKNARSYTFNPVRKIKQILSKAIREKTAIIAEQNCKI